MHSLKIADRADAKADRSITATDSLNAYMIELDIPPDDSGFTPRNPYYERPEIDSNFTK